MESVESVEEAVATTIEPVKDAPELKAEPKQTLRKSLEKNFKESSDDSSDGRPSDTKLKASTQTEPAVNKSFVNGEAQQVATPTETVLAPASMNAEERKVWETLPIEAKKFLSRRDYETRSTFTRQTEGLSQKEKEVSDILGAVTPEIREQYTRDGIAVPDLVRRSISWDKRVKEGVHGGIEFLAAHGYSPQDIVNHLSSQGGQQTQSPEYLTREEAERLADERFEQKFQLQQQSSLAENNANALQSFISSKPVFKGDPGTAAQVESAIAEEIEYLKFRGFQGSTEQLLETSYNRALANNEAFSSLRAQPAQQQTAKPENIYEQMERVRSAKAASKSASGSLGSGSPVHKSNSLRESLERNFVKSGGQDYLEKLPKTHNLQEFLNGRKY